MLLTHLVVVIGSWYIAGTQVIAMKNVLTLGTQSDITGPTTIIDRRHFIIRIKSSERQRGRLCWFYYFIIIIAEESFGVFKLLLLPDI